MLSLTIKPLSTAAAAAAGDKLICSSLNIQSQPGLLYVQCVECWQIVKITTMINFPVSCQKAISEQEGETRGPLWNVSAQICPSPHLWCSASQTSSSSSSSANQQSPSQARLGSTIVIFSYFSFVGLFIMNGFIVISPGLHCEDWRENLTSRYLIILLPSRPEVTDQPGQQPKQIDKVMSVFPFFSQKANFIWVEAMKKGWMDLAWVGSPASSVIIKTATGIILHDNSLFFSFNSSIHSLFPLRCCFEAGQTQTTVIVGASVPHIMYCHQVNLFSLLSSF